MKLRCFPNKHLGKLQFIDFKTFLLRYGAAWATKRLNTTVVR